jgi:hypothetical protein
MNFLKIFKIKPSITLELSENGFYIVRAYGQWITRTLTKSRDEADAFFEEIVSLDKDRKNHTIVKAKF